MELLLMRAGAVVHVLPVAGTPVHVGRAPVNELVVADATVSGHHLVAWQEDGALWVKDLGSTNGTFLNDRRMRGASVVQDGDRVRLGASCILAVRIGARGVAGRPPGPNLALEDVDAGLRFPIVGGRFVIGAATSADYRLPDGPSAAAVLFVHGDGEIRLGTDDGSEGPVEAGQEFQLGGRRFRVVPGDGLRAATELPDGERHAYRVECTLQGAVGPEALLQDPATGATHRVEGGNRAILLFLLARRSAEDAARGVAPAERGWCPDDEVKSGIWGRHGDENKLNVLLHRVRADLRTAGFDPWCIEKRQRAVRLCVAEATIR